MLCPVVIGRDAELKTLATALGDALRGQGRCVFLTGEPGIGKSRLAREVAVQAAGAGAAVVVGRGVSAGASAPYRPLTEALLQALRGRPVPAEAGLAPWLPTLGAIIPGIGETEYAAAVYGAGGTEHGAITPGVGGRRGGPRRSGVAGR